MENRFSRIGNRASTTLLPDESEEGAVLLPLDPELLHDAVDVGGAVQVREELLADLGVRLCRSHRSGGLKLHF